MKACLDGPGLTPTSKRIKEQFENGREYYGLEGRTLQESEQPMILVKCLGMTGRESYRYSPISSTGNSGRRGRDD